MLKTFKIKITGIVQGVGFRPLVYNIAKKNNINGEVSNTTEGVVVKANFSSEEELKKFINEIILNKPKPSIIENIKYVEIPKIDYKSFNISKSIKSANKFQLISPDLATCDNCVEDIFNKNNKRRYYYPFTNCTNCGPRFTIIKKLPYDRKNTTMNKFKMCKYCQAEYDNPENRRFHAQPNACNLCGPKLILTSFEGKVIDNKNPIKMAAKKLKEGAIVGIKSLGGFQIACDATNNNSVNTLRKRKKRKSKPFALMFKDINMISKYLFLDKISKKILTSSAAPIVLLKKRNLEKNINKIKNISFYVSTNNKYEGAMIPYTPLHHLLFNELDFPLVMTSGNISEEPIVSLNEEAFLKLKDICDFFLIHDRDIYSKYDDSLVKIFNSNEMIIRRARGYAPYPLKIDNELEKITIAALGAQEKNSFCMLKDNYAIVSQHLGDMDSLDSRDFFISTFNTYTKLFNISNFSFLAIDKHPTYFTTKYSEELLHKFKKKPKLIKIQHHKAHIASIMAENKIHSSTIGFAWDGTGYGDDGKIWGSEIFIVDEDLEFRRIGHLTEKMLPGGEITIKKPYRMALVYLYEIYKNKIKETSSSFEKFVFSNFPFYKKIVSDNEIDLITLQIEKKFHSSFTTSMGRFFDAVSSILDLTHIASYEGEAAINLEMISLENNNEVYDYEIDRDKNNEYFIINDLKLFEKIIIDILNKKDSSVISSKFHNTLSLIILDICKSIRLKNNINFVALGGGVFQNNYLIEKTFKLLENNEFKVFTNYKVPVNDGGIALGQAYLALKIKDDV